MNERWHTAGFAYQNAWLRQPQNEVSLSSLEQFRRRGQEGFLESRGKISPGCEDFLPLPGGTSQATAPSRHTETSSLLMAFCLFLSYSLITSLSVIVPPLFPLQPILLCQCSIVSYPENRHIHKYIHITEFTRRLHTTAICFVEFHRC